MEIFFSGLFWGTFFILIGASFILKALFGIALPIGRIFFGIAFLYLGVSLITGLHWDSNKNPTVISSVGYGSHKQYLPIITVLDPPYEYSVIFGSTSIDFTQILEKQIRSEISIIFGAADIYIDPNIPTRITINNVFAQAHTPNGNKGAIGTHVYANSDQECPQLNINVNVVFGNVNIKNAQIE